MIKKTKTQYLTVYKGLNGSSQRTKFEKFTRTKAKKNSESIDTKRFWKNKNQNKIQNFVQCVCVCVFSLCTPDTQKIHSCNVKLQYNDKACHFLML
jgi:hypothetical protein